MVDIISIHFNLVSVGGVHRFVCSAKVEHEGGLAVAPRSVSADTGRSEKTYVIASRLFEQKMLFTK